MVSTNAPSSPALLGDSDVMVALRADVELAARTHAKVLIAGETGAGKEIVARLIHAGSPRRERAFVALNSSGVPDTLLESELFGHVKGSFTGAFRDKVGLVRLADRGTLFLDEVAEMSLRMQAVLLRFVETGEIQPVGADRSIGRTDVRIITATNRDLHVQIAAQQFREDLFHRLNVVQIRVPALRERASDVVILLHHFLRVASETHGMPCPEITAAAQRLLVAYPWPGNVRELKNLAERLVVQQTTTPIAPEDLPPEIQQIAWVDGAPPQAAQAAGASVADGLWARLMGGDDFWSVVHRPFKTHDITRQDVRALIQRGLRETRGSYRELGSKFHLKPTEYKRFLGFLHQHDCHLPFRAHRVAKVRTTEIARPVKDTYNVAS